MSSKKKPSCWEFKGCGRDKAGDCPAYPKAGHVCFMIAGTMCGGKVQGSYALKIEDCRKCDFYRKVLREMFPDEQCS